MAFQIPSVTATASLGQFLVAINGFIRAKNGEKLGDWVVLEPPFNPEYQKMISELREVFPKGTEEGLEEKCAQTLTVPRDGVDGSPSWSQFTKFMVQYLTYLRDVDADPNKYLETYELLYELQKRANSALTHGQLGNLMLPIVVSCAKLICRLAIGLDKQPGLIANLKSASAVGGDDGPRETLPERAAELLRAGLTTCLNDRGSGIDAFGRPEGKKRGIYTIANVCLKIFFQCRKTRNAEMIFTNIGNLSPPLSLYPKPERITYLYYLGRFWFQNNHFRRACLALQAAYDECPISEAAIRQRRQILVYLIACNIIMGRFPTLAIFNRPEAQGFHDRFFPLLLAIRSGNLARFHQHLDFESPHADWFLHFRILLQLRNRCEVLVWRSLVRKTYILHGTRANESTKAAPLIDMNDLVIILNSLTTGPGSQSSDYTDPDLDGVDDDFYNEEYLPKLMPVESILSSLVDQGFLRGFIANKQMKFVFTGAKAAGGDALAVGFPTPAAAIARRLEQEEKAVEEVPGWKKAASGGPAVGGGRVMHLSGVRAVGAA